MSWETRVSFGLKDTSTFISLLVQETFTFAVGEEQEGVTYTSLDMIHLPVSWDLKASQGEVDNITVIQEDRKTVHWIFTPFSINQTSDTKSRTKNFNSTARIPWYSFWHHLKKLLSLSLNTRLLLLSKWCLTPWKRISNGHEISKEENDSPDLEDAAAFVKTMDTHDAMTRVAKRLADDCKEVIVFRRRRWRWRCAVKQGWLE